MAGVKGKSGGRRKGAGRKAGQVTSPKKFEQIEDVYSEMQTCENKDLSFPQELKGIPHAKECWDEVLALDRQSKYPLLNARHKEILKSYCYSVAMRSELIKVLAGSAVTYKKNGETCVSKVVGEINKLNKMINAFADDLGLTVLSSYKMAVMAKNGESLDGSAENDASESDGMFD
ncbi:MAG: P27 family phage terminase small subunit [Clostridiales bacterium]|nr:P27 family phage terminase small subunit [Clostridiales bacterium]